MWCITALSNETIEIHKINNYPNYNYMIMFDRSTTKFKHQKKSSNFSLLKCHPGKKKQTTAYLCDINIKYCHHYLLNICSLVKC